MIFLFFVAGILLFAVLYVPSVDIETKTPSCPPHSWKYESVYNEDGSVNHTYLVCTKCGPLHGAKDE